MPFQVGDDIVNNNAQTYLVKKVVVIRLPPDPDSPGDQGDIARYHYDLQRYTTGETVTIEIVVEENPDNNRDTSGVTWTKSEQRGGKRKRQSKRTKRRRQSKRTKRRRTRRQ